MVTFAIADNGIGIPKDALRKLGRPFEQVESQLTKSHQGSGLGLAIAKSLAELHGGSMRIRSTLGKGTLVVVRLPLRPQCPLPREERPDPHSDYGALPKIRTKLSRTARLRLDQRRIERGKSGTSAARASSRSSPAPAVLASKGPGRQSRRICVRS